MSFKWYGDALAATIEHRLGIKLAQCGQNLKKNSMEQAPKLTGDLRGDCTVDESEISGLVVRVGYALIYALRQHEHLEYHHADGKAKFLEDPFNANKQKYIDYCGRGLI